MREQTDQLVLLKSTDRSHLLSRSQRDRSRPSCHRFQGRPDSYNLFGKCTHLESIIRLRAQPRTSSNCGEIFQGLGPMMIAGFSDRAGRKPAYIACFSIYMIANLALALQNNYIALLLLRMLQAGGSSGTIVLSNGLVGDLVASSERGKYIAFASVGLILGPSLSPLLGGIISEFLGWHW